MNSTIGGRDGAVIPGSGQPGFPLAGTRFAMHHPLYGIVLIIEWRPEPMDGRPQH
jgi:hypothetical protein